MRLGSLGRRLLRPDVVVPAVVGAAVFGGLLTFAGLRQVVQLVAHLSPVYLMGFAALGLLINVLRCLQWMFLLRQLGVRAPVRSQVFSYLGGALSRYLPGGSYFQNYLLLETRGTDFALSSVATTVIVLAEPAVAMLLTAALGIDHWLWLRWTIGIGLPLGLLAGYGVDWWLRHRGAPRWLRRRRFFQRVEEEFNRFVEGLALLRVSTLLAQAAFPAVYVPLGGVGLYIVGVALGVNISVVAAMAAFGFAITLALIIPIFTDLGTLEAGGVAALLVAGATRHGAVAMMILDRGFTIVLALILLAGFSLAWRDLVRTAFRGQAARPSRVSA